MGEVKDHSQTVFPNIEQSLFSIDYKKEDYLLFLKVSDEFDEYYNEGEKQKLIEFYKERISLHEKSKYVDTDMLVPNKYKDSGFDLAVPWLNREGLQNLGPYYYDPYDKKLCNLRVQVGVYKIFQNVPDAMVPSPFYLYARSSIYKTPFILANNVGIIDSGYRGNLCAALYNTRSTPEIVGLVPGMGKRMVQICMPDLSGEFHVRLVNELDDTSRGSGGFGSTG